MCKVSTLIKPSFHKKQCIMCADNVNFPGEFHRISKKFICDIALRLFCAVTFLTVTLVKHVTLRSLSVKYCQSLIIQQCGQSLKISFKLSLHWDFSWSSPYSMQNKIFDLDFHCRNHWFLECVFYCYFFIPHDLVTWAAKRMQTYTSFF